MLLYENTIDKTKVQEWLPWIEKYRPKKIDDIISHKVIILSLKKFIEMRTLPHLLFFGPSGSGKTTTIKCCASEIYGKYFDCMVLELNASNERGIETVRTKIKNFVSNRNSIFLPPNIRSIFKLVILDEIDSMTVEAQGMLRQTIEKNSSTTRFCLICNDIDKINLALQSRCALFRFPPINASGMKKRLREICVSENIQCRNSALDAIIKISKGDMRAAINTLQYINLISGKFISIDDVYKTSGHSLPRVSTNVFNTLNKLSKNKIDISTCVDKIMNTIVDNNITIFNLLEELKNIVINCSGLTTEQKIFLIDNFSKSEIYDSVNVDPKCIIMLISSIFVLLNTIN
jgi:DNA polymerase III delta prime subunit